MSEDEAMNKAKDADKNLKKMSTLLDLEVFNEFREYAFQNAGDDWNVALSQLLEKRKYVDTLIDRLARLEKRMDKLEEKVSKSEEENDKVQTFGGTVEEE